MSDAQLQWFDFGADVAIENGDLRPDDGLASAVLISLFTDARAPSVDSLPPGEVLLRGWWADLDEKEKTGSLLWLIRREKMIPEVAERAREYCENALAWMLEERMASEITVEAQLVRPVSLQIKITIRRGDSKAYAYLWDAVEEYTETTVQNTSIKLQFIE